jgi:8-oxo-dGTP diphosphatase
VHEWTVAGGLVEGPNGVLLVRNRRRNGRYDWSTPGGVIDATDESLVVGLTREVEEETGLRVTAWEGPLYEVHAVAGDLGWTMRCEVHHALAYEGELRIDDPDGIVVDAAFFPIDAATALLVDCMQWVREPLSEWLLGPWAPPERRGYRYDVRGVTPGHLEVLRVPL